MKKLLLLLLLCGTCVASAQQTNESITVNGVSRSYIQYLPSGFNPSTESLPVLFVLHGLGGTASSMVPAGANLVADTARFIVVYPQALPNAYGQAAWNNGTLLGSTAGDVQLFNDLIDLYLTDYNADETSIYVSGFSMGSIMSHHLACALNNRVAAIAAMAGTMSTSDISSCVPVYKTPVIHLHGTLDDVVPYDSGALPTLSLVPETMAFWKSVHGCAATYDSIRKPDTAADGITVDQFVYHTCDQDGALELWRLNGAMHEYLYQPVNDITEMIEAWLFLRKWHHTAPTTAGIDENASTINVYPNPSTGIVRIDGLLGDAVTIVGMNGAQVGTYSLNTSQEIDLSDLNAGIYLIQHETLEKPVRLVIE